MTSQQIASFKELWKKEFNEELTDEQAYTEANDLVTFLKVVYGTPVHKETYEKYLALKNKTHESPRE